MAVAECVFCEIASGREPTELVYEDAYAVAFEPLNPVVPGHLLVVPRAHVRDFREDEHISAKTMFAATLCAQNYLEDGVNLITSAGSAATQTVFHLHLHLVPRMQGDGLKLPWSEQ